MVDSFPRSCSSKAGSGSSPRSRQTVSEKKQVLESEPLKCTRKQANLMYEEVEKRKKSDDNDYKDDNYAFSI